MEPESPIAQTFPPPFAVRHYSVDELAKLWSLAPNTVRRLFAREAGVVTVSARGKRRRVMLRIPQPVAERVWRRMQIGGAP
jgi:hypothetical protein